MVVPEHSSLKLGRIGQVGAPGAQVEAGRHSGVVNVVRIPDAIAVAINAVKAPAGWDELHRTYCAIPLGVAIQYSMVSVWDGSDTRRSVQLRTQNRTQRVAEGVHPAVAGVIGFNPADSRQH